MSRVRLDQGVIDTLLFEPGKEKVPPFVGRHRARNPCLSRVTGQHFAHAPICVLVLAYRLEQVDRPFRSHLFHVQREQFTKGARKGNLAIFARILAQPLHVKKRFSSLDSGGDAKLVPLHQ